MNTARPKRHPSPRPAGRSAPPLRLSRLYIDNFKSLVEFRLPLSGFSCLIGLNGSGKSTVLQAVDFMSRLFKVQISHWLDQRQLEARGSELQAYREEQYNFRDYTRTGK